MLPMTSLRWGSVVSTRLTVPSYEPKDLLRKAPLVEDWEDIERSRSALFCRMVADRNWWRTCFSCTTLSSASCSFIFCRVCSLELCWDFWWKCLRPVESDFWC